MSAKKKSYQSIDSFLGYSKMSFILTILYHQDWDINMSQILVLWYQNLAI